MNNFFQIFILEACFSRHLWISHKEHICNCSQHTFEKQCQHIDPAVTPPASLPGCNPNQGLRTECTCDRKTVEFSAVHTTLTGLYLVVKMDLKLSELCALIISILVGFWCTLIGKSFTTSLPWDRVLPGGWTQILNVAGCRTTQNTGLWGQGGSVRAVRAMGLIWGKSLKSSVWLGVWAEQGTPGARGSCSPEVATA